MKEALKELKNIIAAAMRGQAPLWALLGCWWDLYIVGDSDLHLDPDRPIPYRLVE